MIFYVSHYNDNLIEATKGVKLLLKPAEDVCFYQSNIRLFRRRRRKSNN